MKSPGDENAATVKPYGFVPGTFSLELIHHSNPERGADVIVTFPWSSAPNAYGVPGRAAYAGGGATVPVTGPGSEHGSFSPWDVHNTLLAWGPDIKRGAVSAVPAGNADIAPTVLALAGIPATGEPLDGRVLSEALAAGATAGQAVGTRIFRAGKSAIQISSVDGCWYVDKAWSDDSTPEPQGPLAAVGHGVAAGSVPATLALTLLNGTFALPSPLEVSLNKAAWTTPVSHDPVTIAFKQHVGAGDALRTGTYSKTLTFTLSTSTP